jgi:bloom syndrome protein
MYASFLVDLFLRLTSYIQFILGQMVSSLPFAQEQARSYQNLDSARRNAAKKNGYNSSSTRGQLSNLFHTRFGSNPYEWQLDVTEAILLGLDSVVIAGTSSGKTIPFMLPLLLDDKKKIVIISPLKVL